MNTHKNMLNNKKEMIYHTHMYTCKLVSTTKSLGTIELKPGHLNQIIEQNISIKIPNIIKISTSILSTARFLILSQERSKTGERMKVLLLIRLRDQ